MDWIHRQQDLGPSGGGVPGGPDTEAHEAPPLVVAGPRSLPNHQRTDITMSMASNTDILYTTYILNSNSYPFVAAVAEVTETVGSCSLVVTFRDTKEYWRYDDADDALRKLQEIIDDNGWVCDRLYSGKLRDGERSEGGDLSC